MPSWLPLSPWRQQLHNLLFIGVFFSNCGDCELLWNFQKLRIPARGFYAYLVMKKLFALSDLPFSWMFMFSVWKETSHLKISRKRQNVKWVLNFLMMFVELDPLERLKIANFFGRNEAVFMTFWVSRPGNGRTGIESLFDVITCIHELFRL